MYFVFVLQFTKKSFCLDYYRVGVNLCCEVRLGLVICRGELAIRVWVCLKNSVMLVEFVSGGIFTSIPNTPITTGSVVVLRCHILVTSISKSLYLLNFPKILSDPLVSLGTDISMRKHVLSFCLAYLPGLSCQYGCPNRIK